MAQIISRSIIHQKLLAAVAAVGLFAGGCQPQPANPSGTKLAGDGQLATKPDTERPWSPQALPATMPAAIGGNQTPVVLGAPTLDPAAALVKRMEQYTASLDHAVGDLTALKTEAPSTPPSTVKWEPKGSVLPVEPVRSVAAVETVPLPLPKPVMDATPGIANQASGLPGTGNANSTARLVVSTADLNRAPAAAAVPHPDEQLEQKFLKHIQEFPHDVWAHLDYQLLKFIREEQDPQMASLTSLPREDRETIQAVLDALSNFRNMVRADPNMLLSKKVQAFIALADRLRSQADLIIPTLALCTKVDGFGVYEPIEPARFVAGKEHMAIVYCEVENFASQINDRSKQWETKLTQETVLYREDGLAVWQDKVKSIIDLSRNRRHDFFIVKMVKLPSTLTIGRYLMKVSIQDMQANRVSEATVPVEIVAQ